MIKSVALNRLLRAVGAIGTVACLVIFAADPSFPTPDKLIVFLTFVFMIFNQTVAMLKRLLPFVVMILIYESFRGLAHHLNTHVNYTLAPHFDRLIFGNLPTVYLQNWLWRGHTSWYDYALYLPYMLFFVAPIGLAVLIWKTRDSYYWEAVSTYVVLLFAAFLTFFFFPAAPPWMASQMGYIQHIHRISTDVWYGLGIHNFPSVYNHLSPNPVAAVPSLHAAMSVLFSIIIFRLYGRRWGIVSLIFPITNIFGIIYEGEHYAFDAIMGTIYAFGAYWITPHILRYGNRRLGEFKSRYSSNTKNVLKSAR